MKFLLLSISLFIASSALASSDLKTEICEVFATEYSGDQGDENYEYDDVYYYCHDVIEPVLKTDDTGTYYEFELFICGNTYQDATMAYTPETKELEDLAGSGSGAECPYASEE